MCELYLIFHSCCGVSVRIGLVYIAVLSIVTGALITEALKKAGVDIAAIASVADVKDILHFDEEPDALLDDDVDLPLPQNETDETRNVIVVTPKSTTTSTTTSTKNMPTADNEDSTLEIIEDIPTTTTGSPEPEEDGMNTQNTERQANNDDQRFSNGLAGGGGRGGNRRQAGGNDNNNDNNDNNNNNNNNNNNDNNDNNGGGNNDDNAGSGGGSGKRKKIDIMTKIGSVNRNGLKLLSCTFIVLGMLLIFANFSNSTELAVVYVALSLVNCAMGFSLLMGVLTECIRTPNTCLLAKLDWLSSFILMMFWFFYIFVWLYFTGVANGFANGIGQQPFVHW